MAHAQTAVDASAALVGSKDFEDMSQSERDAAKKEARRRPVATLRVCADPGNMPFSNMKGEGFENRIYRNIIAIPKATGEIN